MSLLTNKCVLIVEDTTIAATYLARELTEMGADVVGLARTESQAVEMANALQPQLILMDIHLGEGGNGISAAKKIRSQHHIPLIYTTSFSDDSVLSDALDTSPYGYIVKPFDHKTIKVSCETALKRFELEMSLQGAEARFRLAAEAADAGIFALDESGHYFTYTGAASLKNRLGGGTQTSVDQFWSLFDEKDRTDVLAAMKSQTCLRKTIRIADDGAGNTCWLDILFSGISIADERVTIGAVVDVTEQQQSSRKLQLSSIILDQLAEGVAVLDASHRIIQWNRALYQMLGCEDEKSKPLTLADMGVPVSLVESSVEATRSVVQRHKLSLRKKNNVVFPAFVTVSRLEEAGSNDAFVITISDLSELQNAERKLKNLAFSDGLTGAGNRQYLSLLLKDDVFTQTINSLVFIDIDNFSQVNELYGHGVGDALLVACATRIERSIQEVNILIRQGGDKFVVLIQDDTDVADLSSQLLNELTLPCTIEGHPIAVTASIGYAKAVDDQSCENLLKCADIAVFEAKRKGKNRAVAFSQEQPAPSEYRLAFESEIRTALANDEICTLFRPVFSRDEKLTGLEARFSYKGKTIQNTAVLNTEAGSVGLQNPLWMTMLRELCIASKLLSTNGLQHVKLFVDSELLNIRSPAIAEQFATFIEDFHVPASQFVLGINPHDHGEYRGNLIIRTLHARGFKLYLSPFAQDAISLKFLQEESVFAVKLDVDLLAEQWGNSDRKMLCAIANFARVMEKELILDGVNTPVTLQLVSTLDVDYFLGRHFGLAKSLTEIINSRTWYGKKIS